MAYKRVNPPTSRLFVCHIPYHIDDGNILYIAIIGLTP